MKRVNSDFTITLPASIAGRELQIGDSVTLKIYTVNRNNFYNYTYEDCTIPEALQVASQWLDGMESGVVYLQVTAHVTDETMPDGYYDEAEEYTTDYFWIQPNKSSVITEIVVKELNDKIEANTDAIAANTEAISDLDERVNNNAADILELQGEVGTLQTTVGNLSGKVDANETAIQELQSDLDSNYYTETEVDNLLAAKQDTLTFDSTPTANSTNPVTSGGIKSYVDSSTASADKTFIVNFTYDGDTDEMTADKSCTEIYAAWHSGKAVLGVTDYDEGMGFSQLILSSVEENDKVVFSMSHERTITNYTSESWNGYTYGINFTELSPLKSPEFIDTPKAPTAAAGTDTNQIATTKFVNNAVSGKADTATVNTQLAAKADASAVYTKSETDTALAAKQNTLTFDSTPTANSTNPVTSGGVYTALSNIDLSDYYTKDEIDEGNQVVSTALNRLHNEVEDLSSDMGDISTALSTIIGSNS